MHTDERVFHTRDHRLRVGPDRGADAGAVSATAVCSSARPRARLHSLADSGRHQHEESELGRGQDIAALRNARRLRGRLRPAEAPHHSGVADAGRLHDVLRVSQYLRPATRGAVVACVGHPRGTGRRRRRRAVRRWLTTLHHVPDAPPAGQRSSARHFLMADRHRRRIPARIVPARRPAVRSEASDRIRTGPGSHGDRSIQRQQGALGHDQWRHVEGGGRAARAQRRDVVLESGGLRGIVMIRRAIKRAATILAVALAMHSPGVAAQQARSFYVLNQRSIALTAEYWNPILTHVSRKSGVPLELKLARTAKEGNAIAELGKYDFLYTNHFFTPERDRLGYKVIARPAGPGIRSQIVVPVDSPIQSLQELKGKDVAFVTPDGFTGYWLPMDALLRAKVDVKVVFTGNQEASSAQLRVNKVAAAGVNSSVMARYGRRESFDYRALWTSDIYQDLCIMANPKVPADKVAAVRAALVNMAHDAVGRQILEAGADLLKSNSEPGFVTAENRDYDNYRKFYRTTQVK